MTTTYRVECDTAASTTYDDFTSKWNALECWKHLSKLYGKENVYMTKIVETIVKNPLKMWDGVRKK